LRVDYLLVQTPTKAESVNTVRYKQGRGVTNKQIYKSIRFLKMQKIIFTIKMFFISFIVFSQVDTISTNVFQINGNLGIGINSPTTDLEIIGDGTGDDIISIKNNNYSRYAAYSFSSNPSALPLFVGYRARGEIGSPQNVEFNDRLTGLYGCMYVNGYYRVSSAVEMFSGSGISSISSPSYIKFGTTNSGSILRMERMRIDSDGNVGIGTNEPEEKLVVNGNILIKDNNALILSSPNGTEFKITVDDYGRLITSQPIKNESAKIDYDIDIFHNSTNNELNVSVNDQNITELDAEIYNLIGKMIFMKSYSSNSFQINTRDLSIGTYLLKLEDSDGKLIKTKNFRKQ